MTEQTTRPVLLTRREAILKASAMLGGVTLIGQAAMLAGCERQDASQAATEPVAQEGPFSAADVELMSAVAETILPETDTPGAMAAGVGPFIALMVTDTYSPEERQIFTDGLAAIDRECEAAYGRTFVDCSADERLAMAERLDREQFEARQNGGDAPPHYFRMLKELTVLGFFTSEVAYEQVLEYAETPGRYEPCRELDPGVRMQAGHASSVNST